MARLEWFAKYGVEPGRFDPINSRKMTAPIIAEMLLDMLRRQEIERLAYKTERWPGTPQQCRHEGPERGGQMENRMTRMEAERMAYDWTAKAVHGCQWIAYFDGETNSWNVRPGSF